MCTQLWAHIPKCFGRRLDVFAQDTKRVVLRWDLVSWLLVPRFANSLPFCMQVARAMYDQFPEKLFAHRTARPPNGYFCAHIVANPGLVGNCLGMDTESNLTSVWQPGSTVYSACTLAGSEVLLWLVPHVYEFESLTATPETSGVSFAASALRPAPHRRPTAAQPVPLVPRWWVFEDVCAPNSCVCGMRTLPEAVALLPSRLANHAVAAHVDLHEAVQASLVALHAAAQFDTQFESLLLTLSVLSDDLRLLGLPASLYA